MNRIKFAIIGSGWRSKFYIRIAKALPKQFELTSMLFRNKEKADLFRIKYNINTTTSNNVFLDSKPHFVVVAVNKSSIFEITKKYLTIGIPVLAETPAGLNELELNSLWEMQQIKGCKIQIAEQYFMYPYYNSVLKEANSGKIGEKQFVSISAVHDYHAASLFRRFLDIKNEDFIISGKSYNFNITETDSRNGKILDGRIAKKTRNVITIEFENKRTVFYNFSNIQYFSDILFNEIKIQGSKGEICNKNIVFINDKNDIVNGTIVSSSDQLLPDDEYAISKCLIGMENYIQKGKEFYPLSEALQDSYISILMQKALETGEIVKSEKQSWA